MMGKGRRKQVLESTSYLKQVETRAGEDVPPEGRWFAHVWRNPWWTFMHTSVGLRTFPECRFLLLIQMKSGTWMLALFPLHNLVSFPFVLRASQAPQTQVPENIVIKSGGNLIAFYYLLDQLLWASISGFLSCPLDYVSFESTDVFISVVMLFRTASRMKKVKANIQRKKGQRKKDVLVRIRCLWSGPLSSRLHDNTIDWPLGNPTHKCHGSQWCRSVDIEWVCVCCQGKRGSKGCPASTTWGPGNSELPCVI